MSQSTRKSVGESGEKTGKPVKTVGRPRKPLPRGADGLLLLPDVPFRIHSKMTTTAAQTARLCNALVEESRELRQRIVDQDVAHSEFITKIRDDYLHSEKVTRDNFLKRAQSAEKVTDLYRAANTVRRQLQNALRPEGVTDEQPEVQVNDGYRFCYAIGDLAFTHEVFMNHASLFATSRDGALVRLQRIRLELDFRTGRLTPTAYMLVQQLRQHAKPTRYQANQTFMDKEVFDSIYRQEDEPQAPNLVTGAAKFGKEIFRTLQAIGLLQGNPPVSKHTNFTTEGSLFSAKGYNWDASAVPADADQADVSKELIRAWYKNFVVPDVGSNGDATSDHSMRPKGE